jgi:hypothetical protein
MITGKVPRRKPKGDEHKWDDEDDLITCYFYRFVDKKANRSDRLDMSKFEAAQVIGTTLDSFVQRISNFEFIDTGRGRANRADRSVAIWNQYKDWSEPDLRKLVLEIIAKKRRGK